MTSWFRRLIATIFKHAVEGLRAEFKAEISAQIAAAGDAARAANEALKTASLLLIGEAITSVRKDVSSEFKQVGLALTETRRVVETVDHKVRMVELQQRVEQIRNPELKPEATPVKRSHGEVDLMEHEFGNPVRFEK
jgi:uncharacterized protein with HEPN domain